MIPPPSVVKRFISISLRLLISAALLWLLFQEHDLIAEIAPRLGAMLANWPWAAAGVACAFASLFLTAVRWHILLRGLAPALPLGAVLRAEIVGAFFNISSIGVMGGDAYKIMSLSRRLPGRTMPVGMSLLLDHLTGLLSVAVLFLLCVLAIHERWHALGGNVRVLVAGYTMYVGGAAAGVLAGWILMKPAVLAWGRRTFPRIFGRPLFAGIFTRLERAHGVFMQLRGRVLPATLVGVVMHVLFFMSFYCGLRAVGGMAGVLDVFTAMPVVDAAASLPVSVSGLGVREHTFEALLAGLASVPETVGVSASLAGWLFNLFWGLVGGLLFLQSRHRTDEAAS